MKIIIIILCSLILGFLIYFVLKERLNSRNKIIISIIFVVLVICIAVYTHLQDNKAKEYVELVERFERGEKLVCGDITVSKNEFNLLSGTQNFIGIQGSRFAGKVIVVNTCK